MLNYEVKTTAKKPKNYNFAQLTLKNGTRKNEKSMKFHHEGDIFQKKNKFHTASEFF